MSELRWTLLILGVVFIAALSWWERRRPRQAFAPRLRETSLPPGDVPAEPWIGEAGLSDVVSSDVELTDAPDTRDHTGDGGVHSRVESQLPGPLEELPTLIIPDADERVALRAAWDETPNEPVLIDPEAEDERLETSEETSLPARIPAEPVSSESIETIHAVSAEEPPIIESRTDAPAAVPAHDVEPEITGAEGVGKVRIVESALPDGIPAVEPIVDWPPEESRRILALRLVAPQPERFPGRALRLALAAEGFVLGKFAVFHKPDEANRAVLSAASLTRPGSFDLETMDSQRYGGLSLFAVLPGPKLPQQAFEELLATARNLNERLEGALQDERGGPLTPLRVASLRESLRAEAATLPAASANEA